MFYICSQPFDVGNNFCTIKAIVKNLALGTGELHTMLASVQIASHRVTSVSLRIWQWSLNSPRHHWQAFCCCPGSFYHPKSSGVNYRIEIIVRGKFLCVSNLEIPNIKETKTVYKNAAAAKSLQSCPTLCNPIDGSPPGSPVPGILQARTLQWVAISFNAWKWKVKVKSLSRVRPSATPWTAGHQAPPSMGFSRQKYWSGVPLYFR